MNNQVKNNTIPRRQFIGLAGGAVGMAALATLGIRSGWAANPLSTNLNEIETEENSTDILVIGGGMAGLYAGFERTIGVIGSDPFRKRDICL
jgi:hypothetical protein